MSDREKVIFVELSPNIILDVVGASTVTTGPCKSFVTSTVDENADVFPNKSV